MATMQDRFRDDETLVEALRDGDKKALEQVYRMYYPGFESYVRMCGGTEEDARDCFQEGVLSIWVNIQQGRYELRESAAFRTYALGVCKYKWMNKMRSAHRKNVTLSDELPEVAAVAPDEAYEEKLRLLNNGISGLGALCQDILHMFYFEKLSYEEMEVRTGKTADSLKNQKYRCINKLREALQHQQTDKS